LRIPTGCETIRVVDDSEGDLISKERALEAIGPDRLALLAECRQTGWTNWEAIRESPQGPSLSPRARASIVHDGTVAHALKVFPAVMCGRRRGFLILDMIEALVRFKKLDEKLAPSGIPTGQYQFFEEQAQVTVEQTKLWPAAPMLIAGYVLDELGTAIERMVLIMRRRGVVIWDHELGKVEIPVVKPAAQSDAPEAAEVRSTRPTVSEEAEEGK
jgi:hypothetical protein